MAERGGEVHGARQRASTPHRVTPVRLNTVIAACFIVGSACFVLGAVPGYLDAVGGTADGVTFFVGSVFFTTASFAQLLQSQTPGMTDVGERGQHRPVRVRWWAWEPHDRAWLAAVTQFPGTLFFNISTAAALAHNATVHEQDQHVWRPDIYGSTLFLVSSAFGVLALGRLAVRDQVRTLPGQIAWLNLAGSVLFMASALASYVLPSGEAIDDTIDVAGTLLGAACFLCGAALMFPAWHRAVRQVTTQGEQT
jgi:hypothetical protein